MRKLISLLTSFAVGLVWVGTSSALEFTIDKKVPSSYAKVVKKNDEKKVVFGNTATAYTANELNKIIGAYGVSLKDNNMENVPSSYAKVVKKNDENKVVFGNTATAYTGNELNKIIAAYN